MEWVVSHLGHSIDIHKEFYRQTSADIERMQIAKLLLIQDYGLGARFAQQPLEKIELAGKTINTKKNNSIACLICFIYICV